jgi:hypothetical protein
MLAATLAMLRHSRRDLVSGASKVLARTDPARADGRDAALVLETWD